MAVLLSNANRSGKSILISLVLYLFVVRWSGASGGFIRIKPEEDPLLELLIDSENRTPKGINLEPLEDAILDTRDDGRDVSENLIDQNNVSQPRIFNVLNPFDILGNPYCRDDELDGVCFEFVRCLALAGKVGRICKGFRGICCRFLRDCGQRSSQEIVYWTNHNRWEKEKNKHSFWKVTGRKNFAGSASICDFRIIKRTRNHCGIRLEPHIYPKDGVSATEEGIQNPVGTCADSKLSVLGLGDRLELTLCSARDSADIKRYDIDVTNVEEVKLSLASFGRSEVPVDVKIIQMKCSEFSGENLSGVSTGTSGFGTTTPTATTVSPPVISSPAPPVGGGEVTGGSGGSEGSGGSVGSGGSGGSVGSGSGGSVPSSSSTPSPVTEEGEVKPPAPPTTTVPPVPSTDGPVSPPSPPDVTPLPNFSKCGVKGKEGRQGRDELISVILNIRRVLEEEMNERNSQQLAASNATISNPPPVGPPVPNKNVTKVGRRRRIDWAVPQNEQSIFHYFMGPPSIFSTRITYGQESIPQEFPWQVAMFVGGNRFSCGGSVIGDHYILTAAHCVISQQSNPRVIKFHLGDWDLNSNSDAKHMEVLGSRISVHPRYSRSNLQNDIAVVKVDRRIDFNADVRPICLPTSDMVLDNQLATITGWGRDENGRLVSRMHKLTSSIMPNQECARRWGGTSFIIDTMMCMDSQIGDSCNGDSGGPSVMEHPKGSGSYVQIGIVSFGSGSCTDKNLPGVYTRVTKFRDWIRSQMI